MKKINRKRTICLIALLVALLLISVFFLPHHKRTAAKRLPIPGNILDINTIMNVVNDVADSLGIVIDSLVLDAGYVSNDLVDAFHIGTEKTLIGRMPARKGYPFKELYWEIKPLIGREKYKFQTSIRLQSSCLPTILGGVILKQCSRPARNILIFFLYPNGPMKPFEERFCMILWTP
ncbi:hypothetical protein [Clostridium vitabionis]|jgi:hypothetical protein|uniref:hypothetical protein n=1 Tax=Clostridium vitabionis TaxID=2784388 RepID=UPI00188CB3E6|nr:hypothetical protein [Clostridium vitabionis]